MNSVNTEDRYTLSDDELLASVTLSPPPLPRLDHRTFSGRPSAEPPVTAPADTIPSPPPVLEEGEALIEFDHG